MSTTVTFMLNMTANWRVAALAVGLSSSIAPAIQAAEFMVFDGFYTRADPRACAEGGYAVRDAKNLDEVKSIKHEMRTEKRYRNSGPTDYKRGKVVAVYSYTSGDSSSIGSSNCTYTVYNSLSASSTL